MVKTGSKVGDLSTTDVDAGDTFTYKIVGTHAEVDNYLEIRGNELWTKTVTNLQANIAKYQNVEIQVTDSFGLQTTKTFSLTYDGPIITIGEASATPGNPKTLESTIAPSLANNANIANRVVFELDDDDANTATKAYELVAGFGHNEYFEIDRNIYLTIKNTNAAKAFSADGSVKIANVKVRQIANSIEKEFDIPINLHVLNKVQFRRNDSADFKIANITGTGTRYVDCDNDGIAEKN